MNKQWTNLPLGVPYVELPENLYPDEGVPIIMRTENNGIYQGYFIWSGEYIFVNTLEDDIEYRDDIVSWFYIDIK